MGAKLPYIYSSKSHDLPSLAVGRWPSANQPTNHPTNHPTNQPTNQPSNQPTNQPTNQPLPTIVDWSVTSVPSHDILRYMIPCQYMTGTVCWHPKRAPRSLLGVVFW